MEYLLIIEDDPSTLTRLVNVFNRKGFNVKGVKSILAGLQLFKESRPDCVLLDLHLEDGHGLEDFYTRVLRFQEKLSEFPVPIIILTASDAGEDINELFRSGIYTIHSKNDPLDLVEESIRNEINNYKKNNLKVNHKVKLKLIK